MKDSVISIARVLLAKHLTFCVYRYPGNEDFQLAVSPDLLPHKLKKKFRISPFSSFSIAKKRELGVVEKEEITNDFMEYIQACFSQNVSKKELPPETTQENYQAKILAYLKAIRAKKLQKAILSRVFYEKKPDNFQAVDCFINLTKKNPNTFVYLFFHPENGLWLGASPERLMKKSNKELQTVALAGTQDKKKNKKYRWRKKEQEEHQMVQQHIEQVFKNNHCFLIRKEGPHTVETASVAHLQTHYTFQLTKDTVLNNLLHSLHPTPAIAGLPVKKALEVIKDKEQYDREYYCGIIGETDEKLTANLFVNLRCMQVGEQNIAIYVGGGITADSDPREEWEETILKGKTMTNSILHQKMVNAL